MRWHRGENLAGLVGECLQTLGEALPPPFAAFRQHFPFEVGQRGQTLQVFQVFFHDSRVVPFLPVRNRYALDIKNSVKMHPELLKLPRDGGQGAENLRKENRHVHENQTDPEDLRP